MSDNVEGFEIGDRVRIVPGVGTPFVGHDGIIAAIQPHDLGVDTMSRHIVVFEHREKRSFYKVEMLVVSKAATLARSKRGSKSKK